MSALEKLEQLEQMADVTRRFRGALSVALGEPVDVVVGRDEASLQRALEGGAVDVAHVPQAVALALQDIGMTVLLLSLHGQLTDHRIVIRDVVWLTTIRRAMDDLLNTESGRSVFLEALHADGCS